MGIRLGEQYTLHKFNSQVSCTERNCLWERLVTEVLVDNVDGTSLIKTVLPALCIQRNVMDLAYPEPTLHPLAALLQAVIMKPDFSCAYLLEFPYEIDPVKILSLV